ncbi:MAG: DUF1566 domain-containing protein [Methylococcaceae bacterium]
MQTLTRWFLCLSASLGLSAQAADFTLTATPADGQISLSWAAVTGAKAYSLCLAEEPITDIDFCTSYRGGHWRDLTARSLTLTGLSNDTAYSYRLVAFNTRDILGVSNAVTVQPGQPASPPPPTGRLNDTGITASQCYQAGSNTLVSCNSAKAIALNPLQDGMTGRDMNAATNTNDDGAKGFSYTKIDSTGQDLPGYATAWNCVRDNVTGLIWEVKTVGGLRDWQKTYTNYSTNRSGNTSNFVQAVNAAGLCGSSDWRLPTADELHSLVDYGIPSPGPTIDSDYFPNTVQGWFWSSSPYAGNSSGAWVVNFDVGYVGYSYRDVTIAVRLVRGG